MGAGAEDGQLATWKLEDAKARFSEVVRLARERGPQRVTVRGREAAVILSAEDYVRLAPAAAARTLADLFAALPPTQHIDLDLEGGHWEERVRGAPEF